MNGYFKRDRKEKKKLCECHSDPSKYGETLELMDALLGIDHFSGLIRSFPPVGGIGTPNPWTFTLGHLPLDIYPWTFTPGHLPLAIYPWTFTPVHLPPEHLPLDIYPRHLPLDIYPWTFTSKHLPLDIYPQTFTPRHLPLDIYPGH